MRIRNLNIEEFISSDNTLMEIISISAPNESVVYCNLVCCGRNLNNGDRMIVELTAGYKYASGTLTEIIAPSNSNSLQEGSLSSAIVDLAISGSSIVATFSGVNGQDIEVTYWLTYYVD